MINLDNYYKTQLAIMTRDPDMSPEGQLIMALMSIFSDENNQTIPELVTDEQLIEAVPYVCLDFGISPDDLFGFWETIKRMNKETEFEVNITGDGVNGGAMEGLQ